MYFYEYASKGVYENRRAVNAVGAADTHLRVTTQLVFPKQTPISSLLRYGYTWGFFFSQQAVLH